MATASPSCRGVDRSRSSPLISAMTAALANPCPMSFARSPAVAPSSSVREEPSGSVTSRAIGRGYRRPPSGLARFGDLRGGRVAVARGPVGGDHATPLAGDRDLVGPLVGVLVDVGLARQGADLEHDLVGDLTQEAVVA